MELYKIIAIPLIGFLIGYFTNYIAIKMLFYPKKRYFWIQGIIPKRKKVFAKNIARASVSIMPQKIKDLEKIPFIGEKIMDLVLNSIEKEINSLSDEKIEEIILSVAKKELSFITWIGGILGLFIGIVQLLIILF
jgi:uncharacterized membrane protein YheB (UPF0754 family)